MRIAITGAAGFIGRAVVERLRGAGELRLLDIVRGPTEAGAEWICGSFADPEVQAALFDGGIDLLFHLASLPGGAAEADFAAGRRVNLDGTLALFDAAAAGRRPPIIVYTSSIAALDPTAEPSGPDTPLRPRGSYGTHKAMAELYLADLTRRGRVDGRAIRPAGIVARPDAAYRGFATAWMSDLFRAAAARRPCVVPVGRDARIWLQSVGCVADNIVHAGRLSAAGLAAHRAWTLPATVTAVASLVAALEAQTGAPLAIAYGAAPFDQPALDASDALALGFRGDGDTSALVGTVLRQIGEEHR